MPKDLRATILINSQHVKGSETLRKSARQYFCHTFWSAWKKIISKKSALVVYEILNLSVNILPPNEKPSLSVKLSV